jgi:hypothetical protein
MKVVLVTGSRECSGVRWPSFVENTIAAEVPDIVIHGEAKGVDEIAACGNLRCLSQRWGVPADWDKHGKGAGPRRNQSIVDIAVALKRWGAEVIVLAFPGPSSRGTWDCVRRAEKAGLTVNVHKIGEQE